MRRHSMSQGSCHRRVAVSWAASDMARLRRQGFSVAVADSGGRTTAMDLTSGLATKVREQCNHGYCRCTGSAAVLGRQGRRDLPECSRRLLETGVSADGGVGVRTLTLATLSSAIRARTATQEAAVLTETSP